MRSPTGPRWVFAAVTLALIALPLTGLGTAGAAPAPATVYVSPSGSDRGPCSQARPCETIARGYAAARPGAVVELAGGHYEGQQEIELDKSKSRPRVVIRPAKGASVRIDSLDVYGKHVEIRNVSIERDFYVKCGADDVMLRGSKASLFFIRSASNIALVNTEFGPSDDISQIGHTEDCQYSPRNILLDRVYMHDFENPDTHMECLTVQAANNITIRNSRFTRCQDFDIFFKHRSPVLKSSGLVIENNWFDVPAPTGSSSIQFSLPDSGGTFENVLIRNNSFVGKLTIKPDVRYIDARVVGNAGNAYGGQCGGGVVASFNVWGDGGCRGDRRASPGFRDQKNFDLHLAPGSAAINRGDPKSFPLRDIDGQKRPQGGRPDAGADEAQPAR